MWQWPDYILTAQHCAPLARFRTGTSPSNFVNTEFAKNASGDIINDPNGDMVIAKLATPIYNIPPLLVNKGNPPAIGQTCTAVGFGDNNGATTDEFKRSATEIVASVAAGTITVNRALASPTPAIPAAPCSATARSPPS